MSDKQQNEAFVVTAAAATTTTAAGATLQLKGATKTINEGNAL